MEQKKKVVYCLANVNIRLEVSEKFRTTKDFITFQDDKGDCTYDVQLFPVEELSYQRSPVVYEERHLKVLKTSDGKYIRIYNEEKREDNPYAVSCFDKEQQQIKISYLQGYEKFFRVSEGYFAHIGWEYILLNAGCLILHAALIRTLYGAILFSGPSGIGKSTQAELWCRHIGAELLNGDRPILRKSKGIWSAYGSPYAGSSRICVNDSCPVRVIVMLKKSDTCRLRRLNQSEAFKAVFAGLTISTWDSGDMNKACDLAIQLTSEIEVFELSCTPDIRAVKILQNELMKGGREWTLEI